MVGGLFALPHGQAVTVEGYHSSAATFDPLEWDPAAFARMARDAGAAYVVFTTKHHSGYAMFDSALSDFSIMKSPYGKDIVAGLVTALRAEGLRVGFYFSLSDWHHPDYPAFAEEHKPYLFGMSPPKPPADQWGHFTDYMFGQMRELLTGYGQIDVVWFDGGWERSAGSWRAKDLEALIRELQPNILINDRLPGTGDYETPEQFVPPLPPAQRWETCMTMNESWGYNPLDTHYKSPRAIVHTLCEVASRGGNLLLNVSPTGTGAIPDEQVERLKVVGEWMAAHAEAIVGTEPGLEPWQFYGPTTRRGSRTYLHLLSRPYETVTVRGLPVKRVERVTVAGSGEELKFRTRTAILDGLTADPNGEITIKVPESALDPYATVLAVDIADKPA